MKGDIQGSLNAISVQPSLYEEIREKQNQDPFIQQVKKKIENGETTDFQKYADQSIRINGRCTTRKPLPSGRLLLDASA